MKRAGPIWTLMVAVVCLLAFETAGAEIREIDNPAPVAKAFNASRGKPRLVLLLSPT